MFTGGVCVYPRNTSIMRVLGVVFLSLKVPQPSPTAPFETAAADAMGTQTLSWSLSGLDPQCANVPRMMHDRETVGPVFLVHFCPSNPRGSMGFSYIYLHEWSIFIKINQR